MKRILLILAILFLNTGNVFSNNLYPINDKSGGGFIDNKGNIIIEQKFNFAFRFIGNYAIVQSKNQKYGIIDKNGKIVLNFEYEDLSDLSENFVIYKENNKYGIIDIEKNIKSKAIYDRIRPFKEGVAAVCINNKWGFINKKGEIVIEAKYFDVSNFSDGLAAISYEKYKTAGYINKNGKIAISFNENNLDPKEFKEGLAPVLKGEDKSCSYINKKGKIVIDKAKIDPVNSYCGNFYEGLRVVFIDNDPRNILTGYMDKKGKIKYSMLFSIPENVSEGEFNAFEDFNSNMAQITIDYKTGYINKEFKLVIPPIYEFAHDFIGDLAYVKFENKEGYINKKGEWVWSKEREGM